LGLFGAIIIIIAVITALLGNILAPDKTRNANQINLPIALLKPLSSIRFFEVPSPQQQHFADIWWNGLHEPVKSIAIQTYRVHGDTAFLTLYHPDRKIIIEKIPLSGQLKDFKIVDKTFLLGTDGFGRDVLSRIIMGTRVSLSVGLVAVIISLLIGTSLGLMAGYFRGRTDAAISWFINVIWSLPTMLLVVAISFALGKGFWQIFIAIGLSSWVEVARVVRGQVFSIREKEYIQAAKVLGFSSWRIMFVHILPNLRSSLIVLSVSIFGSAILLESGLSFLGLGIAPPAPSWGMMIKENFGYILFDSAYLAIVPGVAIMLLVMAFNFLGIALRDALDIHLQ
jgi:oligopeptide transport system permease protein